ncbi:MAG: transcriptional regulator Spx [Bacilli bacterium]|nr:transcriptional regulator Spx [Bacilli bacterium]
MIKIYTSPSCSSCRKVKKWFDDNQIPYVAKNIFGPTLAAEDLMEVISKCENGTEDIISTRSKIVQEQNIDFDSMTISQLIAFIQKNPSILKRPIIVDDHRLQVGYNEEEIRTFIPRARRLAETYCNPKTCKGYSTCEYAKAQLAAGGEAAMEGACHDKP